MKVFIRMLSSIEEKLEFNQVATGRVSNILV
jgi:hypothetical protein